MATVPAAQPLIACEVTHTKDTVSVKSKTGRTLSCSLQAIRFHCMPLAVKLTRHAWNKPQTIHLSALEMRAFKEAVEGPEAIEHQHDQLIQAADREDTRRACEAKMQRDQLNEACERANAIAAAKKAAQPVVLTEGQKAEQRTIAHTERMLERTAKVGGSSPEERRVHGLQNVIEQATGRMYMLQYDIKTEANEACPNPSPMLWFYGFRLTLSCWVLPEKSLNAEPVQALIAHWKHHAVKCHVIRYADDEVAQIRTIAENALREELIEVHTSFLTRLDNAAQRLAKAEAELDADAVATWRARENVEKAYEASVRGILKTGRDSLASAIACARLFDNFGAVEDLLRGLREVVSAQTTAFNAEMRSKRRKLVTQPVQW